MTECRRSPQGGSVDGIDLNFIASEQPRPIFDTAFGAGKSSNVAEEFELRITPALATTEVTSRRIPGVEFSLARLRHSFTWHQQEVRIT